tara:strand:+ start:844 stop:1029 length:186 start_codon:yes stop_codon:yes gene_type:complete
VELVVAMVHLVEHQYSILMELVQHLPLTAVVVVVLLMKPPLMEVVAELEVVDNMVLMVVMD